MSTFAESKRLLEQYPQAVGLRIDIRSYGTNPVNIHLILEETNHTTSEETITELDEKLVAELLEQTHWQVLIIHLEERNPFVQLLLLDNLWRFKNLRRLQYKHPFQLRDGKISLNGLLRLETVKLHEVEVQVNEPLPQVHTFWLDSFQKADVAQIIAALNPEVLQKLDLRHIELTGLPTGLQQFTKLHELGLTGNKISDLKGIEWLTQLKSLNLNNNQLKHIPIELFSLIQLEELSLIRILSQTILRSRGKTVVLKLMQWSESQQFPMPVRQLYANLIQENHTNVTDTDIPKLVWALAADVELLRRKAMNELVLLLPESLKQDFDVEKDTISLVGKIKGLTAKEAITQLKKHNIKASDKLTDKTTFVCLGESITTEQAEAIIRKSSRLIIPQHLKEFLEQLETPYLKESDEEMRTNLSRLIVSDEENNVKLAVQMMMAGGMPEGLFYQVLWLGIRKGTIHWKLFRSLLEKYANPQQYDFIRKYRQKEFIDVIEYMLAATVFDTPILVKAGVQVLYTPIRFRNQTYPSNRTNYPAFRDIFRKGLRLGGDTARYMYQFMLQDTTLDLLFSTASTSDKFQFAKELLEFEQVTKIVCSHACATMPNNAKLLKKMTGLKELELYRHSYTAIDQSQLAELFPSLSITLKTYE